MKSTATGGCDTAECTTGYIVKVYDKHCWTTADRQYVKKVWYSDTKTKVKRPPYRTTLTIKWLILQDNSTSSNHSCCCIRMMKHYVVSDSDGRLIALRKTACLTSLNLHGTLYLSSNRSHATLVAVVSSMFNVSSRVLWYYDTTLYDYCRCCRTSITHSLVRTAVLQETIWLHTCTCNAKGRQTHSSDFKQQDRPAPHHTHFEMKTIDTPNIAPSK